MKKLRKLDEKYFTDEDRPNSVSSLVHLLATYCYDSDFDVNEESYQILVNIGKIFGRNIKDRVLKALFHRNHDT